MLSDSQKRALLQLARDSIRARLCETAEPAFDREDLRDLKDASSGLFVSLYVSSKLRGCIGTLEGHKPLPELVSRLAKAAAFSDARFDPLQPEELNDVEVEISVLSPLQSIASADEIKVGHHGLLVRFGIHQGILLPQVAEKRGWDAETFLRHVCRKADLPDDAWTTPQAELYCFSAEVFSENSTAL